MRKLVSRLFLVWLVSRSLPCPSQVGHLVNPHSSATSTQIDGNCYQADLKSSMLCNPALFSTDVDISGLSLDVLLQAKSNGLEIANRLSNGDVDQNMIRKLFAEDSFNTFSGLARLHSIYPGFFITLVPGHVAFAAKINNPSLPQLDAWGVENTMLTMGSSRNLLSKIFSDWLISAGGFLTFYNRKVYHISASVVDVAISEKDGYLRTNVSHGLETTLGLSIISKKAFRPHFYMTLNRLPILTSGSRDAFLGERLASKDQVEWSGKAQVDYLIPLHFGVLGVHQNIVFSGESQAIDQEASSSSLSYKIGHFSTFLSHTAISDGFGFQFRSSLYELGMKQVKQVQDSQFDPGRSDHLLLFFSGFL